MIAALCAAGALASAAGTANAAERFRVTFTNLTRMQVMTPPLVVAHGPKFSLFTPGAAASPELAALAEDGNTAPLEAALPGMPQVQAVKVAGSAIPPGGSVSVDITVKGWMRRFSAAGMLATSNDAFYGFDGVPAPRRGSVEFAVPAYDAGSEANSELCAYIPGPPCNNPNVRDTAGAEGFVTVHNGIHGVGDLVPADVDWRNPVAKVTIRHIP